MCVSAILLAAGLSRRMDGCDKLLLPCRENSNITLLEKAIALMDRHPFYEKVLVTTGERLKYLSALPQSIKIVVNHNPKAGQSESLRLGLSIATGEYYLFLAADQPLLDASVLQWLLRASERNPGKIIYPTINGNRCNPTLFPATFREELLSQFGDVGGRKVLLNHPEHCIAIEAENSEIFFDIDSKSDYMRYNFRHIQEVTNS
ncbi:MAG: nucleotidyltransferase family protein [Defluviitaleaceae bacterium]|nr:nucleotidyltransferase family protein [Defluviitaleaceae bacterium]